MRIKLTKAYRKSEILFSGGQSLIETEKRLPCHKIPHMWEGRPGVAQLDCLGSLPTIFLEWREDCFKGKGDRAYKTRRRGSIPISYMYINTFHAYSTFSHGAKFFFCKKSRQKLWCQKQFLSGFWSEFFVVWQLRESLLKGSPQYEEKETINRSGMEMALGVYPHRQ